MCWYNGKLTVAPRVVCITNSTSLTETWAFDVFLTSNNTIKSPIVAFGLITIASGNEVASTTFHTDTMVEELKSTFPPVEVAVAFTLLTFNTFDVLPKLDFGIINHQLDSALPEIVWVLVSL